MRLVAIAALVAGCYHPSPQDGAPCTGDDTCPDPLRCVDGLCVHGAGQDAAIQLDALADAPPVPPDALPACTCSGDDLACGGASITCPAGCTGGQQARCRVVLPSNSVTPNTPGANGVTIAGTATFDTDDGSITGALTRAAGQGVIAGIGYAQQTYLGGRLGVFTFQGLDVTATGVVHFTGARAAVFVVVTDATIAGTIDGSGGCYGTARACAGPGGGVGGTFTTPATGCGGGTEGAGGTGMNNLSDGADSGGGGGGAGTSGAAGGLETRSGVTYAGGTGGASCLATALEPLEGGGGGGGGGPGDATPSPGGGGGGALQLTAFDTLTITGTIVFGGAGGAPGPISMDNAGAPAGGGAGGGILLEAPNVSITATAIVAANGGGGGGASDVTNSGMPGQGGQASATPAQGGAGIGGTGSGGNGGAGVPPTAGGPADGINSGAGGGAAGKIYVRSYHAPSLGGVLSPAAGTGPIRTF